jgi:WD40 repeat protein
MAVLDADDPRRPRLERTFRPPFLAHDVVFAPDGDHVWVTSGSDRRAALYRADSRRPVRILIADAPPQHVTFAGSRAFVASGDDGTVRRHRLDGELVSETRVPVGSYNVTFGSGRIVTPSLGQGTVSLLDRNGRVRAVRRIARAAHDACVVTT